MGVRLRVVLRGVSPVVVRTLEVPAAVSLSDLNRALLDCFGWSGDALHQFEIRGRRFTDRVVMAGADSVGVAVGSFGLRPGERFCWRYDFVAGWEIDVRVETLVDDVDSVSCVSGRRGGPPEWCRGPVGFQQWEDSHSVFEFVDAIEAVRNGHGRRRDGLADDELIDRLRKVSVWMVRDGFDKADVNEQLVEV